MIRLILLSNELTKYMPTHLSDVEEFAAERKDAETVPSQHLEPSHRERLSAVALRQDERAVPQVLLLFHIHSFIHSFVCLFMDFRKQPRSKHEMFVDGYERPLADRSNRFSRLFCYSFVLGVHLFLWSVRLKRQITGA